jgi:HSP20 family protein
MASANDPGQSIQQSGPQSQSGGNGGSRERQELQGRESGPQSQRESGGRALSSSRGQELSRFSSSNPFELMWDLSRQMDRMMNSVFRSFGSGFFGSSFPGLPFGASEESGFAPSVWSPRIDVEQRGDALQVCADLPGVRKEDVNIDLTEEGLTISGERRAERQVGGEEQGYRAIERSYGRFCRTIPLPKGVKTEDLKAQMRDGVLQITIPLDESARPRRIQIQG